MLRQSQGSGERLVTGGLGCEEDGEEWIWRKLVRAIEGELV